MWETLAMIAIIGIALFIGREAKRHGLDVKPSG